MLLTHDVSDTPLGSWLNISLSSMFFGEMIKQTLGMRTIYDWDKIHQLGASFCKQTCAMALVWGRSSIICCIFSWICWEWYTFVFHFFSSSFLVLIEKLDLFNRVALCPIYFNFWSKTINDYIWSYGKKRWWFFEGKIRWFSSQWIKD